MNYFSDSVAKRLSLRYTSLIQLEAFSKNSERLHHEKERSGGHLLGKKYSVRGQVVISRHYEN
jgi:hypothetical protein